MGLPNLRKAKAGSGAEYFLGDRQRQGKRAANVDRNLQIAADVIAKMDAGMTLDDAAVAVAAHYPLTPDSIARIYKRHQRILRSLELEKRAAAAME